ncbi:unnamed protein product, partial [Musa acuminata var. zebrina]
GIDITVIPSPLNPKISTLSHGGEFTMPVSDWKAANSSAGKRDASRTKKSFKIDSLYSHS